jgi:hypothetical protein
MYVRISTRHSGAYYCGTLLNCTYILIPQGKDLKMQVSVHGLFAEEYDRFGTYSEDLLKWRFLCQDNVIA